MTTAEKVAYLKGLMEGMKLDTESNEGKLIKVISEILEDLALEVEDVEDAICEVADELDAVSDDLADLEDIIYDEDDEDDDYEDEDDDFACPGCCCSNEDEDDEEPMFFEVTCPACDNTITIDEDVLNLGSIQCPNCGEMMEFDIEEEDEEEE